MGTIGAGDGKRLNRSNVSQNVLIRHSKDKRLAGSFTQFQKDYRRKKKDTLCV